MRTKSCSPNMRGSTQPLTQGMTEAEIVATSPDPVRMQRRYNRPRMFLLFTAVLIVILWLLLGSLFSNGLIFALPVIWTGFARWVFASPFIRQRYSLFVERIVTILPAMVIFFFFVGALFARAQMMNSTATHRLVFQDAVEEVTVLRSFQQWLLVRDATKTVSWIHLAKVVQIHLLEDNKPFRGLACIFVDSWCVPRDI